MQYETENAKRLNFFRDWLLFLSFQFCVSTSVVVVRISSNVCILSGSRNLLLVGYLFCDATKPLPSWTEAALRD